MRHADFIAQKYTINCQYCKMLDIYLNTHSKQRTNICGRNLAPFTYWLRQINKTHLLEVHNMDSAPITSALGDAIRNNALSKQEIPGFNEVRCDARGKANTLSDPVKSVSLLCITFTCLLTSTFFCSTYLPSHLQINPTLSNTCAYITEFRCWC